jgi:hypothetical protein
MKKVLFFIFLIFFVVIENISGISVYPQQIDFEIYEGEFSCRNVTIISSGNILLNDKWAKKNLDTKEMRLHKFTKDSLKLYLDYPSEIFVSEKERVELCFSGSSTGFYHGVFLVREENSNEGVGIWINGKIISKDGSGKNFPLTGMSVLEDSSFNPSFLLTISGVLLTIFLILLFIVFKRK